MMTLTSFSSKLFRCSLLMQESEVAKQLNTLSYPHKGLWNTFHPAGGLYMTLIRTLRKCPP